MQHRRDVGRTGAMARLRAMNRNVFRLGNRPGGPIFTRSARVLGLLVLLAVNATGAEARAVGIVHSGPIGPIASRPAALSASVSCRSRAGFVLTARPRTLRRLRDDRRYAPVGQAMFLFDGHGCGARAHHAWRG